MLLNIYYIKCENANTLYAVYKHKYQIYTKHVKYNLVLIYYKIERNLNHKNCPTSILYDKKQLMVLHWTL
jgi:hypothetical protein